MKNVNFKMVKKLILLIVLVALNACRVEVGSKHTPPVVNDSIFGEYSYNPGASGNWWEDLFTGTIIKVSPVNSTYIKINTLDIGSNLIFDSVKLIGGGAFSVNQVIKYSYSSTGYANARGTGNFGTKTVSLNFKVGADTLGQTTIYAVNANKYKD